MTIQMKREAGDFVWKGCLCITRMWFALACGPIWYGFAGSRWVPLWGYTWRWNRQLRSVAGITLGNERTPGTREVLCHFIPVPPVPPMYRQEQYSPPNLQRRYNSRTDNFYLDNLLSDKAQATGTDISITTQTFISHRVGHKQFYRCIM